MILLLIMPDSIDRPHVDGAGVAVALRLTAPGIPQPERCIRLVAMHQSRDGFADVRAARAGREFTVDLGDDTLVDGWMRDTGDYAVLQQAPHRFRIVVKPVTRRALVAYTAGRHVRLAAELDGLPCGCVELPADPAR